MDSFGSRERTKHNFSSIRIPFTSNHSEVEDQDVLAITFSPDKAVACFLPPEESVVLTKGLTPKPTRRGGKGRRANCEVMSAAGTEAEYEDWVAGVHLLISPNQGGLLVPVSQLVLR